MDPFLRQQLDIRTRARVRDFVGEHCVLGQSLVVPLFVVWRSYQAYCEQLGAHADADSQVFRAVLDAAPWVRVEERPKSKGLRRTIVHGLGVKSTAPIRNARG